MDRKKAKELLKLFGNPSVKVGHTNLVFARQDIKDIKAIEKMSTKLLIAEWKSLVWINQIYGQVSLNDMQRISLIELEMDKRKGIDYDKLDRWYEDAAEKQRKCEEPS